MVEDWAHEAKATVIVVLVAPVEYVHPRKLEVKVADELG